MLLLIQCKVTFFDILYAVDSLPLVLLSSQVFTRCAGTSFPLWHHIVLYCIWFVFSFQTVSLNCSVHAKPDSVLQKTCASLFSYGWGNITSFEWSKLKRRLFRGKIMITLVFHCSRNTSRQESHSSIFLFHLSYIFLILLEYRMMCCWGNREDHKASWRCQCS